MFQVLDLFSGIGGFSLGLEATGGFDTVAFCECDKKARLVLDKHWPGVKQYDDVKELNASILEQDDIKPDIICGGFPCQDLSLANKNALGLDGERSGLWSEYARLIGEIRPRYAIVENVATLLFRGVGRVLGDLAEIGYDAEWHCVPASAVGAPHRRDRIWIIAYCNPDSDGESISTEHDEKEPRVQEHVSQPQQGNGEQGSHRKSKVPQPGCIRQDVSDTMRELQAERRERPSVEEKGGGWEDQQGRGDSNVGERPVRTARCDTQETGRRKHDVSDPSGERFQGCPVHKSGSKKGERIIKRSSFARGVGETRRHWAVEPNVGRVANGVPNRVDRIMQLGNAVVPQIPYLIGLAILEREGVTDAGTNTRRDFASWIRCD